MTRTFLLVGSLLTIAFAGCSQGGGGEDTTYAQPGAGTGASTTTSDASAEAGATAGAAAIAPSLIGPAGGVVTSTDGRARLEVPAGALQTTLPLSITAISSPLAGALGVVYDIAPTGTLFQSPAILTLTYDADVVGSNDPASLTIATIEAGSWRRLPSGDLPGTHQVLALLDHLSPYCVFGPSESPRCSCNTTCFSQACQFQYGTLTSLQSDSCSCTSAPNANRFDFNWGIDDYYSQCSGTTYARGQCTPCIRDCIRTTGGYITLADTETCTAAWSSGDPVSGMQCEAACTDSAQSCTGAGGTGGGAGGSGSGGAGGSGSGGAGSGAGGSGTSSGGNPSGGVSSGGRASGGASSGGSPSAGAGSGGSSSGGASSGGSSSGGASSGGSSGAGAGGSANPPERSHFHVIVGTKNQTIDCTQLDIDATDPNGGDFGVGYQELGGESASTGQTFKVKAPLSALRLRDMTLVTKYPIATFTSPRWFASNAPDGLLQLSLRIVDSAGLLWTSCGPGDCGLAANDTTYYHTVISITQESSAAGKASFRLSGSYFALVTNTGATQVVSGDWSLLITAPDPGPLDCLQGCASASACSPGDSNNACGSDGQACTSCANPTPICVNHACKPCAPGATQTTACNGTCGTQTMTCNALGTWGTPSACSSGPACAGGCCASGTACVTCKPSSIPQQCLPPQSTCAP